MQSVKYLEQFSQKNVTTLHARLFWGKQQFFVTGKVKDKKVTICSKSALRCQNNIHGCHSSIFIVGFEQAFSNRDSWLR